tara:strand:+ start:61 stop:243 length:183 start_codon:yes stop_codon:yes gene_type:complete
MKVFVGELVELKPYCRDSGRVALVVKEGVCDTSIIKFVDGGEPVLALNNNLLLVSTVKKT